MEDIINQKKKKYIIDGIYHDIISNVKEKERYTFLGSTDRKGYTVEIRCFWLEEDYNFFLDIQPFDSSEMINQMLKKAEEDCKHKFADIIYNSYFSPND